MVLATASKGAPTINEYFSKMKGLADEMASAGHRFEDEELVSYILTRLDLEFNPVVSAVAARVEPISVDELYTQLVSFEQRMELHAGGSHSSANVASKGGHGNGGFSRGRGGGRGSGGRDQRGGCGGNRAQGSSSSDVTCQLCGKERHMVPHCYKRFDASVGV